MVLKDLPPLVNKAATTSKNDDECDQVMNDGAHFAGNEPLVRSRSSPSRTGNIHIGRMELYFE